MRATPYVKDACDLFFILHVMVTERPFRSTANGPCEQATSLSSLIDVVALSGGDEHLAK